MKKIIVTALALFALAGCTSTTDELPSTSAEPDVPATAAESEEAASTSEAIITDCRPRSSRADGRYPWCCFETSSNGTAYCRNGDTRYHTIVTMNDSGQRKACCVARGTKMNVGPAADISGMTQPSTPPVCTNPGHCWRI